MAKDKLTLQELRAAAPESVLITSTEGFLHQNTRAVSKIISYLGQCEPLNAVEADAINEALKLKTNKNDSRSKPAPKNKTSD